MNRELEERNIAYQSVMSHGEGSKGEEIVKGYINALRDENISQEQTIKELRESLKENCWQYDDLKGESYCSICSNWRSENHKESCIVIKR